MNNKNQFGFAEFKIQKMMTKHGWKEGQGLGKSMVGNSKFGIKLNRKYSRTGLGDIPGKDFENEWWHKLYENASKNIGKKEDLKTKIDLNDVITQQRKFQDSQIRNGSYFIPIKFIKAGTITNSEFISERNEDSSSEDERLDFAVGNPTSSDLFNTCGGIFNKNARYGINHSGKLDRVKEQEERFLTSVDIKKAEKLEEMPKKIKKKKKKTPCEKISSQQSDKDQKSSEDVEKICEKRKKKKKKILIKEEDNLTRKSKKEKSSAEAVENKSEKKKKKKRKLEKEDIENIPSKKSKKKIQ